uniref:NADH-ubiquinone oxidoreductase chain 3 n=1 Tax=Eupelmus sp. ZJUH_2016012 TaxID=2491156 RepID=A0A3Q8U9Z8_9HYME|nr:NADH dehydrogenase subunit 3 [Eupelmus sp. ZJUH_2016012]
MFMILLMILMFLLIMLFMISLNFLISMKKMKNREKMSPFECGFDPLSDSRMPFSLQFYLISIIFLIFDVEISLILPWINNFSLNFNSINIFFFSIIIIIIILLIGLYLEWKEGALQWFK